MLNIQFANRLNQRILSTDEPVFIDTSGKPHNDVEDIAGLAQLTNSDLSATLLSNLKYFGSKSTFEKFLGNKLHFLTIWIVGDLNEDNSRQLFKNALEYMVRWHLIRLLLQKFMIFNL